MSDTQLFNQKVRVELQMQQSADARHETLRRVRETMDTEGKNDVHRMNRYYDEVVSFVKQLGGAASDRDRRTDDTILQLMVIEHFASCVGEWRGRGLINTLRQVNNNIKDTRLIDPTVRAWMAFARATTPNTFGELLRSDIQRIVRFLAMPASNLASGLLRTELYLKMAEGFACEVPLSMHTHSLDLLQVIWEVLCCPKYEIRNFASQALSKLLLSATCQPSDTIKMRFEKLYKDAMKAIKSAAAAPASAQSANPSTGATAAAAAAAAANQPVPNVPPVTVEQLHGAVLVLQQFLTLKDDALVKGWYADIGRVFNEYKSHTDRTIRNTVIDAIPMLARFNPQAFTSTQNPQNKSLMTDFVSYMLVQLEKERDHTHFYSVLGEIAVSVGRHYDPFVKDTVARLHEVLLIKTRNAPLNDKKVLDCIGNLARSIGPDFYEYAAGLLELMLTDLTESLVKALSVMAEHIPALSATLKERLLRKVTDIIQNARGEADDKQQLLLALSTLGTFDFGGHDLTAYADRFVLDYLTDTQPNVREQAIRTLELLLVKSRVAHDTALRSRQLVQRIVMSVLHVGVADREDSVRISAFSVLTARFEEFSPYLRDRANIGDLLPALYDQSFKVRECAHEIVAKLVPLTWSRIMPTLRVVLVRMMTTLQTSESSEERFETATLMNQLLQHAPRWFKLYTELIYRRIRQHIFEPYSTLRYFSEGSGSSVTMAALSSDMQNLALGGSNIGGGAVPGGMLGNIGPGGGGASRQLPGINQSGIPAGPISSGGGGGGGGGPSRLPTLQSTTSAGYGGDFAAAVITSARGTGVLGPDAFMAAASSTSSQSTLVGGSMSGDIGGESGSFSRVIVGFDGQRVQVRMQNPLELTAHIKIIGNLARMAGVQLRAYHHEIFGLLLYLVQHGNKEVRSTALETLGTVASESPLDFAPYHKFPGLLPLLVGLITGTEGGRSDVNAYNKSTSSNSGSSNNTNTTADTSSNATLHRGRSLDENLRSQATRVLGVFGAVDPAAHGRMQQSGTDNTLDVELLIDNQGSSHSSIDDFEGMFITLVVRTLLAILREAELAAKHQYAAEAILNMFKFQKLNMVDHLSEIIPGLADATTKSLANAIPGLVDILELIISVVKSHIIPYADTLMSLVYELWDADSRGNLALLNMTKTLAEEIGVMFKPYVAGLVKHLSRVLRSSSAAGQFAPSNKIMILIASLGLSLEEHVHTVVPIIIEYARRSDINGENRRHSVGALMLICRTLDPRSFVSRVVNMCVEFIRDETFGVQPECISLICILMERMQADFMVFAPTVNAAVLRGREHADTQYSERLSRLMSGSDQLNTLEYQPIEKSMMAKTRENETAMMTSRQHHSLQTATTPQGATANIDPVKQAWHKDVPPTRTFRQELIEKCLQIIPSPNDVNTPKDGWQKWFMSLATELLHNTPSSSLAVCFQLAHQYSQVVNWLFCASFVAVYISATQSLRDQMVIVTDRVVMSDNVPQEVLRSFLRLAEYFQHTKINFPVNLYRLAVASKSIDAHAKALRFKETELALGANRNCLVDLISINRLLGAEDAAMGILERLRCEIGEDEIPAPTLEDLRKWPEALKKHYDDMDSLRRRGGGSENERYESICGVLRCMSEMFEFDQADSVLRREWPIASNEFKSKMAVQAAHIAWSRGKYDDMREYAGYLSHENAAFYKAILEVRFGKDDRAMDCIKVARAALGDRMQSALSDKYVHAYQHVVRAQVLAELEEIVEYRSAPQLIERDEHQRQLVSSWSKRLSWAQRDLSTWHTILNVHSLVLKPRDEPAVWGKFISMCCKRGLDDLGYRTVARVVGLPDVRVLDETTEAYLFDAPMPVTLAYLKLAYRKNPAQILDFAQRYSVLAATSLELRVDGNKYVAGRADDNVGPFSVDYLARLYFSIGMWKYEQLMELVGRNFLKPPQPAMTTDGLAALAAHSSSADGAGGISGSLASSRRGSAGNVFTSAGASREPALPTQQVLHYEQDILHHINLACNLREKWYKGWHTLALRYSEVAEHLNRYGSLEQRSKVPAVAIAPAVQAYLRAIGILDDLDMSALQDTLRLLTLLVQYGENMEVSQEVDRVPNGLSSVAWLKVLPQLIARIDINASNTRKILQRIVVGVGRFHPQALVFPLATAAAKDDPTRPQFAMIAKDLMAQLRVGNERLVHEAEILAMDFHSAASLMCEQWNEILPIAVNYQQKGNYLQVVNLLRTLYRNALDTQPRTALDVAFLQGCKADINQGWTHLIQFARTLEADPQNPRVQHLEHMWNSIRLVVRRVASLIGAMKMLKLDQCTHDIYQMHDFEISIPGTYNPNGVFPRIREFCPTMEIIPTKKKPRKLVMIADSGRRYMFLLKGMEDMRMDERAMQLFSLVNTMLRTDPSTKTRQLGIITYPVITITPRSGLIGWVEDTVTLNQQIKAYRQSNNMPIDLEISLFHHMTPAYVQLPELQRIEVFEYAISRTSALDLARMHWNNSRDSETWHERRSNYTRSVATTSMVGYLFGLGDRHPANIMVKGEAGALVHIDFGECFEVTMDRDQQPELNIPFRLTRMMIMAMEAGGYEDLLRKNRESVMAIFDSFLYDPIVDHLITEMGKRAPDMDPATAAAVTNAIPTNAAGGGAGAGGAGSAEDGGSGDEDDDLGGNGGMVVSEKARKCIDIVEKKLQGYVTRPVIKGPFDSSRDIVERLIENAISPGNLALLYIGWCAFW
ncbi:hypothetical protein GQ42DRAFT_180984 [Ramicandelaber brevisporus]|nr:hypothetical protein GQ42DRAFT_180984 [Ramicandelaber brevisporus]